MNNETIMLVVMAGLFLIALPFFLVRFAIEAFKAIWSWAPVIIFTVVMFFIIQIYFPA